MPEAKSLWVETMDTLQVPTEKWDAAWRQLESLYADHGRHYHTMTHIDKMSEALRQFATASPELCFAIVYHDAIYDSSREDNEEESAILASKVMSDMGIDTVMRTITSKLILTTKVHQPLHDEFAEVSGLFLDLDLLILGAPALEYDAYSAKIHKEYAWVPDAQYKKARARVLRNFANRPQIYFTKKIRDEYESAARENLARELESLDAYI